MNPEGSFSDEIMMDPEDPMSDVLYSHDYNMNWLRNLTDDLAMDDISVILSMVGNGSSLNQTLADIDNLFTLSNDLFFRVSQDNSNMFEFITEGVLLTAVSIFGLVGNIIAIVVLSRPSMKGSFSTLLIGLSSFDLLYLTIAIAIFGLPAVSPSYSRTIYVYILPVSFGFGHIGRVGSVFVTTSVTIERYFAIVHPLKHFSAKKFLLLISAILAVLYNIPKFYELERKVMNGTNVTVVSGSALRSNPIYVTYYIFWSKFILIEVIPYFIILVLNSLIIGKIWKSTQFRKRFVNCENEIDPDMTSRQKREANLGVVLISISILFILCQSVKIIPDMYEVAFCRLGNSELMPKCPATPLMASLIDISHLLLAINSSANFIIYTWRGQKFREVLTQTFCFRKTSRLNNYSTTTIQRLDGNGISMATEVTNAGNRSEYFNVNGGSPMSGPPSHSVNNPPTCEMRELPPASHQGAHVPLLSAERNPTCVVLANPKTLKPPATRIARRDETLV
ncbi:FMRFamide receptor-like [Tigriopus californicus]|uniref:FMRFamide receptor-like n=1 Tax=Tigriopus californicus TaxID=6832 RepID=UPI0027DA1E97|nr:FMRFamide receptor-like [Tigriopus californicus]